MEMNILHVVENIYPQYFQKLWEHIKFLYILRYLMNGNSWMIKVFGCTMWKYSTQKHRLKCIFHSSLLMSSSAPVTAPRNCQQ